MRTRIRFAASALALLMLVGAACAPATPPAAQKPAGTTPAPAAAGAPKRGGELRMLLIQDSQGMDPAKTTEATAFLIGDALFDTLVEAQPDGKIVPSLAESWDITPDGLTYTFKLRKGVKFHNGREMTSADVKYTIERIKDKATAAPRVNSYTPVSAIDTPDPSTVVLRLQEPFAPLLANLTHVSAGIVPKEVVEQEGDLHKKPVGTGPFKFVEWVRDQHVKVEANKDYWRQGQPYLDRITFTFNSDENARTAALRSGSVDFLYAGPSNAIDVLRKDSSVAVYGGEGMQNWLYMLLNVQKDPFKDVRVRQAIFAALDREQLTQLGRPGTATPLNGGFLPNNHWAAQTETVWKQDYEQARKLLADAGKSGGFKVTLNSLVGWDFQNRTAQAIQQQLKPLNIDVEVRIMESGAMQAQNRNAEFEAMIIGFSGTMDPDERFQQTFVTGGGTNYAKFSDPKVDELAAAARRTTNQEERARIYREAQKQLALNGPWAFLYTYHNYDALRPYVKGYTFHPGPMHRSLREVWLDK